MYNSTVADATIYYDYDNCVDLSINALCYYLSVLIVSNSFNFK